MVHEIEYYAYTYLIIFLKKSNIKYNISLDNIKYI